MSLPAQEYPDRIGFAPEGPPPFTPYIPPGTNLRELTPIPIIVGAILGLVFGASSLYLVLKVGLTVSASIPVAVISITLFRLFAKMGARDATILEHLGDVHQAMGNEEKARKAWEKAHEADPEAPGPKKKLEDPLSSSSNTPIMR